MGEILVSDIHIKERLRKDLGDIEELAKDILNNGLISPIAVQKIEKGYKLLAGERRLRAINLLGKNTIEATVITVKDEQQALHIEIDENIKRKSFTREETVLCGLKLEKIYRPLACLLYTSRCV